MFKLKSTVKLLATCFLFIICNEVYATCSTTGRLTSASGNTNNGTIITCNNNEDAISSSDNNVTNVNNGAITTNGIDSYGFWTTGASTTNINNGTITLNGQNSYGMGSAGASSTIINNGTITTNGHPYGYGINIESGGANSLVINSGVIRTNGAIGINISDTDVTINNSGQILTTGTGYYAPGISSGGNNLVINNSGLISSTGYGKAIQLFSSSVSNNIVNLNRGSVIVGDIFAYSGTVGAKLNFNLGASVSYDYSVTGPWTITDLNNRPMVTGSAHAAGIGNVVTTSQSMYERTSQISQSIDDRLRTYDLKQNTDQPYWINTYYSDSGRGGQGLLGSNLSFNQYRSGVTAGFHINNSYTPTELIVNYEHGKLNIDEGNQGISSNSVMAGLLFPDITKVFTGTLSARAFLGYSDYSGDRKVLTNDVAYDGSRNVTANYQSTQLNLGAAWTKTLYQTDKMTLDTLVGMDLNTQHINSYSESDLFKWHGRTMNQLQERAQVGMEMKPLVNPLTLFGRIGIERRDLISGENQNFSINNTEVSYEDTNQRNTYVTLNAGAYYPLTQTVKAYAQVRYYDSTKNIDSLAGSVGVSGQF